MKAALFKKPHHLSIVTRELRRLREGELLVKVEACGICGTDVHIFDGTARSSPPVVLGHEYMGVVEDAKHSSRVFKPGQRVAIDPNISCGKCYFCLRGEVNLCSSLKALGVDRDGGLAQFCIVPEGQAFALPKKFATQAAPFIEPVSCVIHGADKANIRVGDTVVILGGGTIGLIMLQLVRNAGASRTILFEPQERKRSIAKKLGATEAIDPSEQNPIDVVKELTGVGADVVIECAGVISAAKLAVELVRRGGTVEFFGVCPTGETIPVEPSQVYFKELTIIGSYVNPRTFGRAVKVLNSGVVKVGEFDISTFPLDGVKEAIESQRKGTAIKSIVLPNA